MSAQESSVYDALLIGGFAVAALVFAILFAINAPYGRYQREGWGPSISATGGWVLMEVNAALWVPVFFFMGNGMRLTPALCFVALWSLHYLYRGLVYPFRRHNAQKRMALLVAVMGVVFNLFNGYMNGRYLGLNTEKYDLGWFTGPTFVVGAALFLGGLAVNFHSDEILLRLRAPGETEYKIPRGGLYRWISCPNYFGELIEWCGWAIMTWSLPGLLFAVWTAANLVPRAVANHRWYREKFPDYPPERRAIVPFLF